MKSQARAVVIGGGIIGCSTLYHLTRLGWSDVVLVDKNELTSGSTWMAAGNTPHYNRSFNMSRIHKYGVELYQSLEAETGQSTGWHQTGSLRLAHFPDRLAEFRHVAGKDKMVGIRSYLVSPEEMKQLYPLMSTEDLIGGLWHPDDGHVDPAGVTQALAAGAKQRGAEIYRFNPVRAISARPGGEWRVETEQGTITCEVVINAAGLWAPAIGAMVGLDLPIIAMEHQHVLFDDVPEVAALGKELPLLRDPDVSYYLRQEMNGLLVGPYEAAGKPWKPDGAPLDYAQQELPPDLDRIQEVVMGALKRVPALAEVGIKHITNGPITYTPDSNPLIGPAFGLRNFYIIAGFSFGITQAAGAGRHLAEWIVEGEPGIDLWEVDSRRFGEYAGRRFTLAKINQNYPLEYAIGYPNENRPAGRPVKTSPIYDLLKEKGAVFAQTYGWERPTWFALKGQEAKDRPSFGRANWFEPVAEECRAVRERVGVQDLSGFAKFEIHGPDVQSFLDRLCANRLPENEGRIRVTQMLNRRGCFKTDLTVTRLAKDRYYVVSAAAMERHDLDWLLRNKPDGAGVEIDNVTSRYGVLIVAGPRSRELLSGLTNADLKNEAFPFLTMREIQVGYAPVRAARVNFVGELGWELHHPVEYQRGLYQAVCEAGRELGLVDFGLRAMDSLRLEKGYCTWGGELNAERTPLEAGLMRFVSLDKGDFIGREALLKQKEQGPPDKLACLTVEAGKADAIGNEPVWFGEKIVGRVASGGYGHWVGQSLAMAYLRPELARPGTRLNVQIFGEHHPAQVVRIPLYDPENQRIRS